MIRKVIKWCCHVCLGSKYKFCFKKQKYGKSNCRNAEGPNLSCWCCCKPWFSDLFYIKEHHEARQPVNVKFKQMVSYLFRGLPNDVQEILASWLQKTLFLILSYFCSMPNQIGCTKVPPRWNVKHLHLEESDQKWNLHKAYFLICVASWKIFGFFFFLSPKLKNTLTKNVWEVGEFWTGVLSHSEMPLLRICWKCWTSSWKLTDTTDSHFTEQLPASFPHFQLRPQHAMRSWPTSFSQPVWLPLWRHLLSNSEAT